ncbi:hypothetical protein GLOIN_2v1774577 [Rhizophagus clarus]|uniref:Uncharacterized protein n=1 Tax=Rhizophagus clarus TaxID=94130 RepID=A0A8H3L2T3_9GLOM|nr:hypothetical protein GLOIN_2v1774577 [Rhizophagus clarus]
MSDDAKYYYVNKLDLELAVDEAVYEVFYDDVVKILPKLIQNTSNEKYFKKYILKRLPDHDWSSLKEKQDKNGGVVKAYSLEIERSDDSDTSDTELTPPLTISSSFTAADKSKSVVTPEAPEEEMDISFTEEDQPAPQLHINKIDKPNTDSSTKKDKKKRKKKKSRQDQSHEADQVTKPIPSSSSSNPPVLEESPPIQSSTPEKGKTLGKTDKQTDIYDILIYDIPAKWSNIDILQHLSSWGRIISIQVKRQKKYKTVRCKFEMNELFLEYDTNKSWMAPLNALPVRWFPASWSLKERKERERYQVVIEQPPDDMNTTTLALKENISSLIQRDIRM